MEKWLNTNVWCSNFLLFTWLHLHLPPQVSLFLPATVAKEYIAIYEICKFPQCSISCGVCVVHVFSFSRVFDWLMQHYTFNIRFANLVLVITNVMCIHKLIGFSAFSPLLCVAVSVAKLFGCVDFFCLAIPRWQIPFVSVILSAISNGIIWLGTVFRQNVRCRVNSVCACERVLSQLLSA